MKKFLVSLLIFSGLAFLLFSTVKADEIQLDTKTKLTTWTGGYEVDVDVTNNTKEKVTSWKGSFVIPTGQSLDSIWSVGEHTSKPVSEGTEIMFDNPTWTGGGNIDPGASTSFGFTIKNPNEEEPGVKDLVVNGKTPPPPTPPQPGPGFPTQVFAPYVDVCNWPTFSLAECFEQSNQKYYTLAFIVADKENQASWGGYYKVLDGNYYYGDNINYIRSKEGDVIASFGGANGTPLAAVIKDSKQLAETYQQVIDAYKFTWIDFDVEGAWVSDKESIKNRSEALKILQGNNPDLKVAFCLPVLPAGLTEEGLHVLQSAKDHNVRIDCVNIMTMDFGDGAAPDPDHKMGQYCMDAVNSLFKQLESLYPEKSATEIWKMIGATPMIGQNDVPSEVFWPDDAKQLMDFAKENQLKLLAMWSSNRDNGDKRDPAAGPSHSGIKQEKWEFTHIFQDFMK